MLAKVFFLFLIALPLSLSGSTAVCEKPPPIPDFIPNLSNCRSLVTAIFGTSRFEHDEPFLWSADPSPQVQSRKLPYSFTFPLETNDCLFLVDAIHEGSQDTFPTKLVAQAAEKIVEKCMVQGVDGAETVGAVSVGPKRAIAVILLKRGWMRERVGKLNLTDILLLGNRNSSTLMPALVEDG